MSSPWLELDPESLAPPKDALVRGVTLRVVLSPYDVPDAVRGFRDAAKDRFVIEYRYIDDEPWTLEHHSDGISARIGKTSKRLYGFEIDTTKLGAQAIILEMIVATLDTLANSPKRHARRENYKVARSALAARQGEVFQHLGA